MMTKAVLTKALAVRCNLYLPRAKMVKVKRTEAVENKKAATEAWMREAAGIFPLVAGPMMQVTVDLPYRTTRKTGERPRRIRAIPLALHFHRRRSR